MSYVTSVVGIHVINSHSCAVFLYQPHYRTCVTMEHKPSTCLMWNNSDISYIAGTECPFSCSIMPQYPAAQSSSVIMWETNLENLSVNWCNLCFCICKPNILKGHLPLVLSRRTWQPKPHYSCAHIHFHLTHLNKNIELKSKSASNIDSVPWQIHLTELPTSCITFSTGSCALRAKIALY